MANRVSLKKEDHEKSKICIPCIEGKQYKVYNRYMLATIMVKRLEMLHLDTCGPFRMPLKVGVRVFVLFIDDHTRMVWCSFMKSKTNTAEAFMVFKAKV